MSPKVTPLAARRTPRADAGTPPDAPLRIAVVGLGYVGLVSAACLASFGHAVQAVDVDAAKLAALQRGELPIHEAGLAELVAEQIAAGRLRFAADAAQAFADAALVIVAVGTPAQRDGAPDLTAIDAVALQLGAHARAPSLVVLKSTVPVGTAQSLQAVLDARRSDAGAPQVLSNPEFLREGSALHDFLNPDRIIVGSDAPDAALPDALLRAYAPLVARGVPVLRMDTRSAELSKAASNAMLAVRVSFINEIAAIAEATGADIERVRAGLGSDARIGPHFLRPGLGYGGSCFPKDVAALRYLARQHHLRADVLGAAERVNGRQRCWPIDALRRELGGPAALRGLRVAVWGLAFKPGTDDMREAPSLLLIERLRRAGVQVALHDPAAMANARALLPHDESLRWCDSAAAALVGADLLMLATEWPEYLAFEPAQAAAELRLRLVFDGRNALDAAAWGAAGLRVFQVGRPAPGRQPAQRRAGSADLADDASLRTLRAAAGT